MPKKQKSGLYRTKIKIGIKPDGSPLNKWISGKTKAELERNRAAAVAYYITGEAARSDVLFGNYAVEWYRTKKEPVIRAGTRRNYRTIMNNYVLPAFGARNIRAISSIDVQRYLNTLAGKDRFVISAVSSCIHAILESACADGYIKINPADHVTLPKAAEAGTKEALPAEHRKIVERVAAEHKHGEILGILYYTGMREAEMRGLRWEDIDFVNGLIRIERIYSDPAKSYAPPKTKTSVRTVPLVEPLRAILAPLRGLPGVPILSQDDGRSPLSRSMMMRHWRLLMNACGFDQAMYTPHQFRHTYATILYERGVDPYSAMRLLGHANIKMTMDIYTHLQSEKMAEVSDQLNGIFTDSCKKVAQSKNAETENG